MNRKLDTFACFGIAWQSFRKAWIPICIVSTFIMIFNILPRFLAQKEISALKKESTTVVEAAASQNPKQLQESVEDVNRKAAMAAKEVIRIAPWVIPFTVLFTVILLLYSNRAVKGERGGRWPITRIISAALLHLVLALIKTVAFFTCIVPGVFLYIKFYFVPLIMLEKSSNPFKAVKQSWRLTDGNFWQLLLIVFFNGVIQFAALPSIIGMIPATGYANTVRAAAYRSLLNPETAVGSR